MFVRRINREAAGFPKGINPDQQCSFSLESRISLQILAYFEENMVSALPKLFFLLACANFLNTPSTFAKESPEPRKSIKEKVELTNYDRRVLENGEVVGFRRVAGSLLSVVPGFGVGHAVQGRYLYKGMIFTLIELGSVAMASGPTGDAGLALGILSFFGFKIWEFVDSLVGPVRDNRRYRLLNGTTLQSYESPLTLMPVPLVRQNESGLRSTHFGLALTWNIP